MVARGSSANAPPGDPYCRKISGLFPGNNPGVVIGEGRRAPRDGFVFKFFTVSPELSNWERGLLVNSALRQPESPRTSRLPSTAAACVTKYRNVFLSAQKHFLQVAKIWAGPFALGPNLGENNDRYQTREMCSPSLFVRDNSGQVLQPRVRGNSEKPRHRVRMQTHRMQRQQHALAIAKLPLESPLRIHQERNSKGET